MSEERLARIEKNQDDEMRENAAFRGEVREYIRASDARFAGIALRINAVEKDAKDSAQRHSEDPDAHPAAMRAREGAATGRWANVWMALGALGGLGGLAAAWHEFFGAVPRIK